MTNGEKGAIIGVREGRGPPHTLAATHSFTHSSTTDIAETANEIITSATRNAEHDTTPDATFTDAYLAGDLRGIAASIIPGAAAEGSPAADTALSWIELLLGAVPAACMITVSTGLIPRRN